MSWPQIALAEVADVVTGSTPRTNDADNFGCEIPFVTPADLGSSSPIVSTPRGLSKKGANSSRLVPEGAALVCCIGSLGKIGFAGAELVTNQQINAVVFDRAKVLPRYGFYACCLLAPKLKAMAPATTVPIVSKSKFQELTIAIPPLDVQKRIATILDQADALRRLRQRAIDRLNQLGQSIFYNMFGDPAINPKGWEQTTLGSLIVEGDRINYGVVQPGDDLDEGIPLVRVGDLFRSSINPESLKKIAPEIEADYTRSRLRGDEILVGCVGSIGVINLAHSGLKDVNIARAVGRVPIDTEKASRIFIAEQLRTQHVQDYFRSEVRVVAQPTLNIKQLIETPVLLPPKRIQDEFAERVSLVCSIIESFASTATQAARLFASLQHRAFRGEL